MRNGQKRMRGRGGGGGGGGGNNNNHRKGQNPLTRVYESNGPDVKIRGTASHIAEKYMQLARDAQSSGDPVAAENYFQHAEHYFRLIAAAQEQLRQQNPYYNQQPPQQGVPQGAADENFDDDEQEGQPFSAQDPGFAPQPQQGQPYLPRDTQFPQRAQQQPQQQPQPDVPGGLPAFITGGQPASGGDFAQQNGGNGNEQGGDRPDRFGRRRRRHRGGFRGDRPDYNAGNNAEGGAPAAQPASDEPPAE
ncbi:DUF4167 domain-containing protein [Undibacter mobilis]|uniref:DUF4167 domain-containing protein n=1 Tax=Undibacter mobilis TaxID=2292256 RepID=A0A371BDK2_9BRAD|nr:DUF4167 domain-containing protein [Undibacter mobilis]RDV05686.1 DUF4167 domain-containing protein [Undibacter mobilis]